jgi:hypothetical protein
VFQTISSLVVAFPAINTFPQEIGMTAMAGILFNHVDQYPP